MNNRHAFSLWGGALVLCAASPALATEYGTVVSSTPVIARGSVPQRECRNETVSTAPQSSGGGALVGALIGGVVGNSVGAGMGRAAATALGVVGGAAVGDRVEANAQPPGLATVQRCRTVSTSQDQLIGYDVIYDYNGTRHRARLPDNPGGPGTRIALEVEVLPVATVHAGRVGTPVPPADELASAAPREYVPVYEPPVVYAYPRTYYYPAPQVWVGGVWGWGGGWGGHHGHRGHGAGHGGHGGHGNHGGHGGGGHRHHH